MFYKFYYNCVDRIYTSGSKHNKSERVVPNLDLGDIANAFDQGDS